MGALPVTLPFEYINSEADFELVEDLLLDGGTAGYDILDSAPQLGLNLAEDYSSQNVMLNHTCSVVITLDWIVETVENRPYTAVQCFNSLHYRELNSVEQPGDQSDCSGSVQLNFTVYPLDVPPPEADTALEQNGRQIQHNAHDVCLGQETLHDLVTVVLELGVGISEDPVQVEVGETDPLGHSGGSTRV